MTNIVNCPEGAPGFDRNWILSEAANGKT